MSSFTSYPQIHGPSSTAAKRLSFASVQSSATATAPTPVSYLNLLLDVRAFVANPCAPGETAELYFSLFNKADNRFITEEFCLILNHLGSPARDAEQRLGRLRTLFTELKQEDVTSSTFLVCRLIRNGALRMRTNSTAGTLEGYRGPARGGSNSQVSTEMAPPPTPSFIDNMTDDSFSVTSAFGGYRTTTIDTVATTAGGSVVDGRPSYRRPLACAVLELPALSRLLGSGTDQSDLGPEFTMAILAPNDEATFATLHEDIIYGRTKEYASTSRWVSISNNPPRLTPLEPNRSSSASRAFMALPIKLFENIPQSWRTYPSAHV